MHTFKKITQVNDLYDNAKPLLKWVSKSSKNNQENQTDSKPNLAKKNVPTAKVAPSRLQNISTTDFSTPSFIPDVLTMNSLNPDFLTTWDSIFRGLNVLLESGNVNPKI